MTAPDPPPLPDRSPVARRRATPDPPTQKIPSATAATEGTAGTAGTAAGITVGAQDGENRFGLSVIQIVASTAAAVTAALIGSRLGVAGTLTGAAVASVVSGVGAAVYGRSLLVTRRHMTKALRLVRPAGTTPATPAATAPGRRPSHPGTPGPDDDPTVVIPRAARPAALAPSRSRRPLTVVLAGAAAAAVIFAGSMATVTLVERVKGGPLSGGNSGLTILGGNTSPDTGTTTDETTVTVTPSVSRPGATTPTATVTQTLTPSPTPGSSTSAPPSSTRSSAGSAPPSPSVSTSAAAAGGQSAATAPTAP